MRWYQGGALVGGLLAATTFGACGHDQSMEEASAEGTTPVAEMSTNQAMVSERQPVAGHDRGPAVLKPQGRYQVPQGRYEEPQGEYLAPRGIYGERGRIVSQGQILSQGEYGTYTKPEGT